MKGAIPAEYLAKIEHVPADLAVNEEVEVATIPNTKAALSASVKALTSQLQVRTQEATTRERHSSGPSSCWMPWHAPTASPQLRPSP
jgi:hypothetical protein